MGITNCRQRQIDGDCEKIDIFLTRRKSKKIGAVVPLDHKLLNAETKLKI